MTTPEPERWLTESVLDLHRQIRGAVRAELARCSPGELAAVARPGAGDVTFRIDVRPEALVVRQFERSPEPIIVICEGLGRRVFPDGAGADEAQWCVIVDPLDGSRELAVSKRSAWVLSGVAPAQPTATLADIVWAAQTEVPPVHQTLGVEAAARRGRGATCAIWNLDASQPTGECLELQPSSAVSVRGGFAVFADYFSGSHALIGAVADDVLARAIGSTEEAEAVAFNDQYLATGGCMYLLAAGAYRFVADIRPDVSRRLLRDGRPAGLCAHPYDLCTYLIAVEAGAIVTDGAGRQLSYPLSTDVDCAWVGYANARIQAEMEPALAAVMHDFDTLEPPW